MESSMKVKDSSENKNYAPNGDLSGYGAGFF